MKLQARFAAPTIVPAITAVSKSTEKSKNRCCYCWLLPMRLFRPSRRVTVSCCR